MTDEVQKIREEVERLYNQSLADENRQADRGLERAANVSYGKSKACKELLSFIDSLQEEPVSEDLEEAAEDAMQTAIDTESPYTDGEGMSLYPPEYLKSLFIDGANWQKEQDKQWLAEEHKHIFAKGRDSMKQQMMKDAITARCFGAQSGDALFSIRLPAKGYLVGAEIKVIIIKEE